MARGAESTSSAKRAKLCTEKKRDALERERNELVLGVANARAKAKELEERLVREAKEALAQRLPSVCADLEAENRDELMGKLPPELWEKILDENLHQNDLLALAMTCRFFRDTTKDLGRKLVTNLNPDRLLKLRKSGRITSHSMGWFRWVCDSMEIRPGLEWSWERLKGVVYEGHLLNYAAFQGSVEILRWLVEEKGWELNKHTGEWAGRGGSVKILEHLRGRGYKFDVMACDGAAMGGHLEALKFFGGLDPPCSVDVWSCADAAAKGGQLEVLKFLRAQDPPCPWNYRICSWAAQGGHLDVLEWARSEDPPCPWDEMTCQEAAKGGHLEVLTFLRAQNPPCPWSEMTCSCAAEGGCLKALKVLRGLDPPCPWGWGTCAYAAKAGHLEILKFARGQDPPCPWDEWTCTYAAREGRLQILKFARGQDPPCPWSRSECREGASWAGHQHIMDWIDQQEDESNVEYSEREYSDRSYDSYGDEYF
ncbi:putative ankyrin repeat protein [Chloropicon roscoffensis]|uniref:Ankyrin repeat protein n=1 Tax=Chloropicon roscoffensis TaxID=1461544 RepID=A0AAX4PHH1_9CHLO